MIVCNISPIMEREPVDESRSGWIRCFVLFVISSILFGGACCSISFGRDDESIDEALKKGTDPVWYSAEKRELVPATPASRNQIDASDRYDQLANTNGGSTSSLKWLYDIFEGLLEFARDTWQIALILAIGAVVAIVIFFLLKMQRLFEAPVSSHGGISSHAVQQRKVTDLPFELDNPDIPLLQLVEQYRGRGDYSKAIIYLYSLMLIELDAVGLIRMTKGKTNWTYLRELSSRQEEKAYATTVVHWFEHVFFGKHKMDATAFESLWASFPSFSERLAAARREHR